MLGEGIQRCPGDVWLNTDHKNAFWQIAYHTLFFTHLYLQPDEWAFRPWEHQQSEVQHPDGLAGPPDPNLENPQSGFPWYQMSKLEHQFVNLRHIQHHAAQLADRLRSAANIGIKWVGACPRP